MSECKSRKIWQIGCVSYLNSKPLIEAILDRPDCQVHLAVPSALLAMIETKALSAALTPVVDYQSSGCELMLVPAGGICCDGPTLTVRIYSRKPAAQIRELHADTDSHTSIILAQIILRELYGVTPAIISMPSGNSSAISGANSAMLLIGDKVVNAAPNQWEFPHQLDLGEEWKRLTGLPFVFAMWMMRADDLDDQLARILAEARRAGRGLTRELVAKYAAATRWPPVLAEKYFTEYLKYEITPEQRKGLELFFQYALQLGLLKALRPIRYFEPPGLD